MPQLQSKFWKTQYWGKLHYWERAGAASDSPLLFAVHGFMDSSQTFRPILEAFPIDWRLVLVDLPGHGDSDALPLSAAYGFENCLGFLVFCEGQLEFTKHRALHLLGHSLGAAVLSRYAGMRKGSLDSLVLLEGVSAFPKPELRAVDFQRWQEAFQKYLLQVEQGNLSESRPLSLAIATQLLKQNNSYLSAQRAEEWAKSLIKKIPGAVGELDTDRTFTWKHDPSLKTRFFPNWSAPHLVRYWWSQIKAPCLLILGESSDLLPGHYAPQLSEADKLEIVQESLREIEQHFKNLETTWIESAGHNMHQEKPEAVISKLQSFYKTFSTNN